MKKIAICPQCHTKKTIEGRPGQKIVIQCDTCGKKGIIRFQTPTPTTPSPSPSISKKPPLTKTPEPQISQPLKKPIPPKKPLKPVVKTKHDSTKNKKPQKIAAKKEKTFFKKPLLKPKKPKQHTPTKLKTNKQKDTSKKLTRLKNELKQPTTQPKLEQTTTLVQPTPEPKSKKQALPTSKLNLEELDFYSVNEPFAYIKILKDKKNLDKYYKVIEPQLSPDHKKLLHFIETTLIKTLDIHLNDIDSMSIDDFLLKNIKKILKNYEKNFDDVLVQKFLYYIKRNFIGYGKIDPLMHDPNIEDISCDGSEVPVFLYHRVYGSLKSNVIYYDENDLSEFVVRLAQKCGKHISIAEPMLDATMPDGSRIQMTLSKTVTAKGSTFTIRKFRADPITATDLINYNTMSDEMVAYMWMAVENGINALISGGTASGKTSALNALALFIPRESKIVSIEETREINLPHPNWIPGVSRSGLGEVVNDKMIGEIGLFELMKAALRQRPEYILVGEIRGQEAYVLFQAMATGHTTYSTVHADSPKSLIHRLEGKPINIPRMMLQSLDIILIQSSVHLNGKNVRRTRQIVEIVDIDPISKEILTNQVFNWDPVTDKHQYSGKSYILEQIRSQYDMSKEDLSNEFRRRTRILNWMRNKNIRVFNDVATVISSYAENPEALWERINHEENSSEKYGSDDIEDADDITINNSNENNSKKSKLKKKIWKR